MLTKPKEKKPKYYLNLEGEFIIENYNFSKPFANFFPGIAGKYGIPMWVFYVNRAQGIASFGTKDKDHSILEFFPANKAWQFVSLQGFRTFIKLFRGKGGVFYEPFHNGFTNLEFNITNKMSITSYDLKIEENNLSLGLETKVDYFTIPQESYAALARVLTIRNSSSGTKTIQMLDGLPQIIPYGVTNLFLKKLGRTIEAWMNVENLDKGVPFYKLDVDPTDRPEVFHIKEGNFYLGFDYDKETPRIIKPIVDPEYIFGPITDFSCPRQFLLRGNFSYPAKQITESKTPCAFLLKNFRLRSGQAKTIYSVVGYMMSKEILNRSINRIIAPDYLIQKKKENKKIIQELQQDIFTESSSPAFNLYAKQTYLDNIMRGGYPTVFSHPSPIVSGDKDSVFYLYSRKHGDLERDYNKFQIQATYFSQGNGNYRDTNQNRRCDIWFNPQIKEDNLITFFNFLQADGFNPLVVKGVNFTLKDVRNFKNLLKGRIDYEHLDAVIQFLSKPFTPGEVILFIKKTKIKLKVSADEFINLLLAHSLKHQEAEHGEGFWTDHWHYNLDLLESYLGIYPENLREIVFKNKVFNFYDNTEIVRPRAEKYILVDGKVKQLHAVLPSPLKREIINKRASSPHVLRSQYGQGPIYSTSLINKLLCLLVNKLASLDPFGLGIEMEADKPNWYDALNGLPALFGSSICETFELKRLILFIKDALDKTKIEKIPVTGEIFDFLINLGELIQDSLNNNSQSANYRYWDKSTTLKEEYRHKTMLGLSGKETELQSCRLTSILNNALAKINLGLRKAKDNRKNIYCAYFMHEAAQYQTLKPPFVKITKFNQRRLPFFLEAQVHALKSEDNAVEAKKLYHAVRKSQLYDKKLKMYKVTAPLKSMPEEIGRCRAFSPGWLENESIWLHMEYKYLLELLKAGLYEEFYRDFKNELIPFQEPEQYGRSILENSSFIVSSAFVDKNLHGNGFVARLSGSTAEFINIWLVMNSGRKPFFLNKKNELNLRLEPILAGWLFNHKNQYRFNFLGEILITYHNPKRKDTFGKKGVSPKRIIFADKNKRPIELTSNIIPSPYAEQIRSRQIKLIDIFLG